MFPLIAAAGPPLPPNVPLLGESGLLALGLALAAFGVVVVARRRR